MRSGSINPGNLKNIGIGSVIWSLTTGAYASATSAEAYHCGFGPTISYPSNGPYARWEGIPLCCIRSIEGLGKLLDKKVVIFAKKHKKY